MSDTHSLGRIQSGICTLPGEVFDNIIDHLHGDIKSLRAGALVSRSWLPSCQYHLFNVTVCDLTRPGRGLTDFLVWLATSVYAQTRISTLTIGGDFRLDAKLEVLPQVCVEDVENAIEQLASLNTLTFRGVTLSSKDPAPNPRRPPAHRTMTRLALWLVRTADSTFKPVLQLLGLFSEIKEWMFGGLEYKWDSSTTTTVSSLGPASIHHIPQIETLSMTSMDEKQRWDKYQAIIYISQYSQPRWRLKGLTITGLHDPVVLYNVLGQLLLDCGGSLTRLRVQPPVPPFKWLSGMTLSDINYAAISEWRVPSLHLCRRLEALEFSFNTFLIKNKDLEESLRLIQEFPLIYISELLRAAQPTLRTVRIEFRHYDDYTPAVTDSLTTLANWNRLDDALHRLEQVEVVCVLKTERLTVGKLEKPPRHIVDLQALGTVESDPRVPVLKKKLPKTLASGRLKFEWLV